MARIKKSIKFYDVWDSVLAPVGNTEYNVTIEQINSVDIAVMTIDEDDKRLHGKWDSGFSEKSDMRSYPLPISGSGGIITLVNDGWYSNFTSAGYSFRGCRVSRSFSDLQPMGDYYVDGVSVGIGIITLNLSLIGDLQKADIDTNPIVIGEHLGVDIENSVSGNEAIYGGKTFIVYDFKLRTGLVPTYSIYVAPTDQSFPTDSLVFDENSYFVVTTGRNESTVMKVEAGTYPIELAVDYDGVTQGFYVYDLTVINISGLYKIDDYYYDNIMYPFATLKINSKFDIFGITDITMITFFKSKNSFPVGENVTVTNVVDSIGNDQSYTVENGVLDVSPRGREWFALETSTPYLGGDDYSEYITDAGEVFYDSNTGVYFGRDMYNPYTIVSGDIGNKLTSTFTDLSATFFFNSDTQADIFTSGLGLQYCYDNIGIGANGLLLSSLISYSNGLIDYIFLTMSLHVIVTAQWENGALYSPSVFAGYDGNDIMLDTVIDYRTSNPVDQTREFGNFSKNHFTDLEPYERYEYTDYQTDNSSNFDDSTATIYYDKNTGVERLEFTNREPLKYSPTRIVVTIYASVKRTESGEPTYNSDYDLELKITELGFYGDPSPQIGDLESVSVDMIGNETVSQSMSNAIEHIASLQDFSKFGGVNINVEYNETPVKYYSNEQQNTADLLKILFRESWYVGGMNRAGTEWKAVSVAGRIGVVDPTCNESHKFIVPRVDLATDVITFNVENVANSGTIKYNNGATISITNPDKSVYNSSYVTGVSDSIEAENLWSMARVLYTKTNKIVEFRSDISELHWLYREQDVIEYITRVFEWNGSADLSSNIITTSIKVSDIDSYFEDGLDEFWNVGDYCELYIPTITTSGNYTGVITGIKYNTDNSAELSVRVGEANENITKIREVGITGDVVPVITETGNELDVKITEVGI